MMTLFVFCFFFFFFFFFWVEILSYCVDVISGDGIEVWDVGLSGILVCWYGRLSIGTGVGMRLMTVANELGVLIRHDTSQ